MLAVAKCMLAVTLWPCSPPVAVYLRLGSAFSHSHAAGYFVAVPQCVFVFPFGAAPKLLLVVGSPGNMLMQPVRLNKSCSLFALVLLCGGKFCKCNLEVVMKFSIGCMALRVHGLIFILQQLNAVHVALQQGVVGLIDIGI